MAQGPKGPLHGIPIGLKDIVDTKGIPTTCQSRILTDNVPDADAACAEKLAAAGTVLIGKTTTHEFADGGPSFDVPWPPAPIPAARPGAPRPSAAFPASSRPMALSAGLAWRPPRSASTISDRWRGPPR